MKTIFAGLCLSLALCPFLTRAQAIYSTTEYTAPLPYATTNNIVVDVSGASAVVLTAELAGSGARTTTGIIGVTNSANATNGQTLTISLGGTDYVYTWTNTAAVWQTNLSSPATNVVIGVTNATLTNGMTLTLVLNNTTNVFTWASAAGTTTEVQTNTSAARSVTNLFEVLKPYFDPRPVTYTSATAIMLQASAGERLLAYDSGGWGTNDVGVVFTVTNIVSTNTLLVASTNSAANATTNLYTVLSRDLTNSLLITYGAATTLQLVTLANPGFTLAQSGIWGTNQLTTNAITGSVVFVASNSVDRVRWFRNAAQDFSLPYSSTSTVAGLTNFSSLPPYGWISYRIENAAANYSDARNFKLTSAVKKGL